MKCPRCWAEKAYLRQVKGWKGVLLACLLLVPLKCNHCYHRFVVSRFFTIGKQVTPPPLRIMPASRLSRRPRAARRDAAARTRARKRAA